MGIERDIADLDRRVTDCEQDIATHSSELNTLKSTFTNYQQRINGQDDEVDALDLKNTQQDEEIEGINGNVTSLWEDAAKIKEEVNNAQNGSLSKNGGVINGPLTAHAFGVPNSDPTKAKGVSLVGGAKLTAPDYGVFVGSTLTYGKHGRVQGDLATYFSMVGANNRGWVFKNGADLVASLSSSGEMRLEGGILAGTDVRGFSDERLKEDMQLIENALEKVLGVSGYTFYRTGKERIRRTGVSAQEIQKILPEAVVEDENGYLTVAYGNLVGILIEAIKEQNDHIDKLEQAVLDKLGLDSLP